MHSIAYGLQNEDKRIFFLSSGAHQLSFILSSFLFPSFVTWTGHAKMLWKLFIVLL